MREWSGFSAAQFTTGHVIRYLPRDYKIFAEISEGWQYPQIHEYVENKISDWLRSRKQLGLSTDARTAEVRDFVKHWRIPYDPSKFPNKWWKLEADKPVRTLLAHLGKDSYSHIHFDSNQARTISMNPALKQIGNAVPALFAYAVAVSIRQSLGGANVPDLRVHLLGIDKSLIGTTKGEK